MDTLGFTSWMNEGGDIFNGDPVTTQTASSNVNTMAGTTSKTTERTTKPNISNIEIGVVETGITDGTTHEQVAKPTIFDPYTHEVVPASQIADEDMDIFTPSIKLTDLFNTNMNP